VDASRINVSLLEQQKTVTVSGQDNGIGAANKQGFFAFYQVFKAPSHSLNTEKVYLLWKHGELAHDSCRFTRKGEEKWDTGYH
jgi:hypothetical protein